ncbi:MAG: PAS domain S-box protein [bacterium]
MSFLQDVTIRRKLIGIIMVTTIMALVYAGGVFILYEQIILRREMVNNLFCQAEIIGSNCKAALIFNDPEDAGEMLASLKAASSVLFACVYNKEGNVLATYNRSTTQSPRESSLCERDYHYFDDNRLILCKQVLHDTEMIGAIYMEADLHAINAMLMRNIGVIGLIILISILVTYFISLQFQKIISEPILGLAQTARNVSKNNDYSIREIRHGNDEIGLLIDSFNTMMKRIQDREEELKRHRDNLEEMVKERTARLTEANEELLRIKKAVESSSDAIGISDPNGKHLYQNQAFTELFGYSLEEFDTEHGSSIIYDDTGTAREIFTTIMSGGSWSGELEMVAKDGRRIPVLLRANAVKDKSGEITALLGIHTDITERKEAEAELERTHNELISTARMAGMAEVATTVLHNVGNVLNSVNTITSALREENINSKVIKLGKIVEIVEEHINDLGEFITYDKKGKKLPLYLFELTRRLIEEQKNVGAMIEDLSHHIQHIIQIISIQQSHAKPSELQEIASLADLIDYAIQVNAEGLKRTGVTVKCELETIEPFLLDRHKVMEIIINLVSNAKDALKYTNVMDKILTVRTRKIDKERVSVEVIDNGIGISKESMKQLFCHGFTTKKDGHGFGLHSAANAARGMGGALTCQSKGEGQGATFKLELPFKTVQKRNGKSHTL